MPNISLDKLIWTIRGEKVILDSDLARLYGVPVKRLNEQVRRNADRFPEDFVFRLLKDEFNFIKLNIVQAKSQPVDNKKVAEVVANCDHLQKIKFSRTTPWAFTEHGAVMAASVLNSPEAVSMSVFVVRAFVEMRNKIFANEEIIKRIAEIDQTILDYDKKFIEHDEILRSLWSKLKLLLEPTPEPPKKPIGFHATN
ncbi:MAG: ORF6N domain-containing protein [Prevotellaceae bacterium]|jgi:hypothetical protein|nr:ORF6N domain-containing protein [Prevotellaceae bacterium]